jgi:hypothetical protein
VVEPYTNYLRKSKCRTNRNSNSPYVWIPTEVLWDQHLRQISWDWTWSWTILFNALQQVPQLWNKWKSLWPISSACSWVQHVWKDFVISFASKLGQIVASFPLSRGRCWSVGRPCTVKVKWASEGLAAPRPNLTSAVGGDQFGCYRRWWWHHRGVVFIVGMQHGQKGSAFSLVFGAGFSGAASRVVDLMVVSWWVSWRRWWLRPSVMFAEMGTTTSGPGSYSSDGFGGA